MTCSSPPLDAAPESVLFHIAEPDEWADAQDDYVTGSLAGEGFIHLSAGHQVVATTQRHYAECSGLLLLEISTPALDAELLRWESAPHGEDYPHLYGALPVAAVSAVHPWPA